MSHHGQDVCACGAVLSQCRCPGPHGPPRVASATCSRCRTLGVGVVAKQSANAMNFGGAVAARLKAHLTSVRVSVLEKRVVPPPCPALPEPEPEPEPEPGADFALRTDRDSLERILAKIRTILGTPDLADVVEQAERVVAERDALKAAEKPQPASPFVPVVCYDLGLADLVRRAAREIRDTTLREALLADLEALLHPKRPG